MSLDERWQLFRGLAWVIPPWPHVRCSLRRSRRGDSRGCAGGFFVCMMKICHLAKYVSRGVEDLDSDIMWGFWQGEHKSWRWLRFRRQMTFPQFVKLQRWSIGEQFRTEAASIVKLKCSIWGAWGSLGSKTMFLMYKYMRPGKAYTQMWLKRREWSLKVELKWASWL